MFLIEPISVGPPAIRMASIMVANEPIVYAPGLFTSPRTNIGMLFKAPIVILIFAPTICSACLIRCPDICSKVIPAI